MANTPREAAHNIKIAFGARPVKLSSMAANRNSTGQSVVEIGISVFLLIILSLVIANIFVISKAQSYNERVCRDSILLAGKAALDGNDSNRVFKAATGGMENCGMGGFFIRRPEYTIFSDDITKDTTERILKLQTRTKVLVPCPVLVFDSGLSTNPILEVKTTYTYKIKNPKPFKSER